MIRCNVCGMYFEDFEALDNHKCNVNDGGVNNGNRNKTNNN